MSVKHTAWVWEHSRAKGSVLLIELALADSVNALDGNDECWPHLSKLAEMTRLGERQVARAIDELVEAGEIEKRRTRSGNRYRFLLPDRPHLTSCPSDTGVNSQATLLSTLDPSSMSGPYVEPEVEPEKNQKDVELSPTREVWDHYVNVFGASRMKLDSTRRTIIGNALKVRSVAECKRAIDGLRVSPFHNGENDRKTEYLGIQYALKGRGGESHDERIDKMIALAPATPAVHGVADIKIQRRIEVIRIWHRSGGTNEPGRAKQAIEDLGNWGFEVTLLDAPPFVQLQPKGA